jgi:hypothetical protein
VSTVKGREECCIEKEKGLMKGVDERGRRQTKLRRKGKKECTGNERDGRSETDREMKEER